MVTEGGGDGGGGDVGGEGGGERGGDGSGGEGSGDDGGGARRELQRWRRCWRTVDWSPRPRMTSPGHGTRVTTPAGTVEGGPLGVPMDHPRAVREQSIAIKPPHTAAASPVRPSTQRTKQRTPNELGLKPQDRSYTGLQRTCGGGGTQWASVDHTHLHACVAEGDGWKDCEMGVSTAISAMPMPPTAFSLAFSLGQHGCWYVRPPDDHHRSTKGSGGLSYGVLQYQQPRRQRPQTERLSLG